MILYAQVRSEYKRFIFSYLYAAGADNQICIQELRENAQKPGIVHL